MVTFSVGGSDDGEGPSNPNNKRQRVDGEEEETAAATEEEQNQQPQQGFEMENSPIGTLENEGNEGTSGSNSDHMMGKSLSAIISDPDVLDCFICSEPLTIPIFQCENGHIACSNCCAELRNKCPMCSMPIGYNRCRAVEKILESIKISCPNAKYGCKDTFSCNMKSSHEKECIYIPCKCPHRDCDFLASSKELALHFTNRHVGFGIPFTYDKFFSVSINTRQKEIVLLDQNDARLFIVHNNRVELGNVVQISCLGPKAITGLQYDVLARCPGSTLILQSSMKTIQDNNDSVPKNGFILIPSDYSGFGQLKLDIRIRTQSH